MNNYAGHSQLCEWPAFFLLVSDQLVKNLNPFEAWFQINSLKT